MRCFIAISLPEELKAKISAIQENLKTSGADASWTRSEGMHLTLKFLGEIDEKNVPDIKGALDIVVKGISPFSLSVSGMGVFPDIKRPRVVWIGLKENGDNLNMLQKGVEAELTKIGFPVEGRRFTPHITLGRIRSNKNIDKLLRRIADMQGVDSGGFDVSDVRLIRSELKPSGAVYSDLHVSELKAF